MNSSSFRRPPGVIGPRMVTRSSERAHENVERDLAAERANALGRAGHRLEDAIDTWKLLRDVGEATDDQVDAALGEVAAATYALIVQRECVGFRFDNLGWIRRNYDVPDAALRRI